MKQEKKYKILLCEDDTNLGIVLKDFLENHGYEVILERDGRLGLVVFQREKFDLCLFDVMMPNLDGFELAKAVREHDLEIPLFFITAKEMKEDIKKGYNLGADDYITKPFDPELLELKIKAILKRLEDEHNTITENFEFKIGIFNYNAKLRILKGLEEPIILSPKENGLLRMLIENLNDLVPRDKALKKIWGSDTYFNGRSMDVYIAKLRKYLKDDPNLEITNIHGEGFMIVEKKP